MKNLICLMTIGAGLLLGACTSKPKENNRMKTEIEKKADEFVSFKLTTDLSVLTEKEKQMLPHLFQAAQIMNEIFWMEAFGDKEEVLAKATSPAMEKFIRINYGPWERLSANEPFIEGYGEKPAGANFYPVDMTKAEFEAWEEPSKTSLYTLIRRDEDGKLKAIPYHEAFSKQIQEVVGHLRQAAELAEDEGLKKYLELRAEALLTDEYYESDVAWMDMKTNTVDFVVGPIENYEDQLFGYKAAHEAFILVKDKAWSKKLEKYAALLPDLQKALPTADQYKSEMPGSDSDMNAYDVIYYAGDCNAGSKTIAINLPNDEQVRANKGSRKLQLKNSMQAKFDQILMPITDLLIVKEQRGHVKFDAFFENTMFHEVAHGLGMGSTVDGSQTVREALKETYTSLEESKADILGLWVVYKLNEMGEFADKDLMDNFVTFMAGIFRSVRFGAASAHGKANMIRFYYFQEKGAFEREAETGMYRVNFEKMKQAMIDLSDLVLTIQGDGDYEQAKSLLEEKGFIREELQLDLDRIGEAGIPVDIVFEQGPEVVGL
ncbi:dipeptidyl-peptidase 3 family protein [Sunxiuqinia elliptica]|uniref:Peptidase M49-like protein n=1 Tax=Sunxiuqinia elliptica TaxID=655355 RepID=A0A4R6GUS6_9BACT|nr:Zn-dependent hydrolase [Sunxiuqinia elliptica]TDN99007.1 peptidase M49-like protein [Sunxiuqinia elliptica]TDO56447.1 peptidase M49-like protein [Sunxiuqinia elliptica]